MLFIFICSDYVIPLLYFKRTFIKSLFPPKAEKDYLGEVRCADYRIANPNTITANNSSFKGFHVMETRGIGPHMYIRVSGHKQ